MIDNHNTRGKHIKNVLNVLTQIFDAICPSVRAVTWSHDPYYFRSPERLISTLWKCYEDIISRCFCHWGDFFFLMFFPKKRSWRPLLSLGAQQ